MTMNATQRRLSSRLSQLEDEIEAELKRRRAELHADFEDRKVRFEKEIEAAQQRFKTGIVGYIRNAPLFTLLTAPIIYSGIVPLLLLDIYLLLYQAVCFPVYGIKKVRRRDYLIFDRKHLVYLNIIEKLNCAYCSYANGLAGYYRAISGRTEQYWCPIKHARRVLHAHPYYHNFTDFGDAEAYHKELESLRRELATMGDVHKQ
jgi:hypothetical protein